MQRYHPFLVALHWGMALMIFLALAAGGLVLANMPADSPDKVSALGIHMIVGMVIGALLLVRLVTRLRSTHPTAATTGNDLMDRIGGWTHWAFYILIAAMVLSGLATAFGAGLSPLSAAARLQRCPRRWLICYRDRCTGLFRRCCWG